MEARRLRLSPRRLPGGLGIWCRIGSAPNRPQQRGGCGQDRRHLQRAGVVSTSASKVYSGPVFPAVQAAIPNVKPIERKSMNVWVDETARNAVLATGRKKLIVSGMLTEACVSFSVLSVVNDGFEVHVVADACGGLTEAGHDLALRRMEQAGAKFVSWLQLLLEFQRDWTRKGTYENARGIVVQNGGGYGMGLAYAREMIHS
jgi:nicotinamidase-related amidase